MTKQEKEEHIVDIFAGRQSCIKHTLNEEMAATIIQRWARKNVIKKDKPQFEDSFEFRAKRNNEAERQTVIEPEKLDIDQIEQEVPVIKSPGQ